MPWCLPGSPRAWGSQPGLPTTSSTLAHRARRPVLWASPLGPINEPSCTPPLGTARPKPTCEVPVRGQGCVFPQRILASWKEVRVCGGLPSVSVSLESPQELTPRPRQTTSSVWRQAHEFPADSKVHPSLRSSALPLRSEGQWQHKSRNCYLHLFYINS